MEGQEAFPDPSGRTDANLGIRMRPGMPPARNESSPVRPTTTPDAAATEGTELAPPHREREHESTTGRDPRMSLDRYVAKRRFGRTPEPDARAPGKEAADGRVFVVQKHDASRLHYDLRLEHQGVLLSWAVPKGPSLDPADRRLAVRVEDHPLDYGDFEGVIPEGEYGGGTVLLWDRGRWEPDDDPEAGLQRGKLSFELHGRKLGGRWTLIRMGDEGDEDWLLVKGEDDAARQEDGGEAFLEQQSTSVATGRGLEEISEHRPPAVDPASLPDARPGPLPDRPRPQLATRVSEPPEGDDWIHEIKLDGYRILSILSPGKVRMLTRRGNDWTGRFPAVASALARLPVDRAVLDGEVVALESDGTTNFQRLQRILGGEQGALAYFVFDLLHLDGYDLTAVRLLKRKEALAEILRSVDAGSGGVGGDGAAPVPLRFTDHVRGRGRDFHGQACRLALEGTISKRADGPYRARRSRAWRKTKCVERQEFVVGGFSDPSGARRGFGSLLLGYHDPEGALHYAGRVGTGFTDRTLADLRKVLDGLEREDSHFVDPPAERDVHWTDPLVVVEVEFTEWTDEGVLRHPSFKGIRDDREPQEVTRETPDESERRSAMGRSGTDGAGAAEDRSTRSERPGRRGRSGATRVRGVRLTHPDRVLYPEQGVTKRRLVEHYERVGDRFLAHAASRPLTLLRCPRGTGEECFYQKHRMEGVPDVVGAVEVEESGETRTYMYVDSVEGLIALVQMGTLEIHLWGARTDRLERPDRIVFDLDPGPEVRWSAVVDGARELRKRLDDLGLRSFPMTTGGKGLHVTVPIVRRNDWDEVKGFARAVAMEMADRSPDRYVAKASKAARRGRVYVDYLRNAAGATAVAPFSTRARAGAPVAVPLRWDELGPGIRSDRYDVDNVARRLAALEEDPWQDFFSLRQSITREAREAVESRG